MTLNMPIDIPVGTNEKANALRWPFLFAAFYSLAGAIRGLIAAPVSRPTGDPGCFVMAKACVCSGHKKTGYISRFFYVRKKLMHVFMIFIILRNM